MSSSVVGTTYDNLFHVTDWFPTILDMAGISYTEADGYEFDGVSHYDAMILGSDVDAPRDVVLYNAYANVASDYGNYSTFDVWTDGTFAIRDSQYKLMHAYLGSNVTSYEWGDEVLADDDSIFDLSDCKQDETFYGEFSYMLFDLINDPYESTNIYSSTDQDVVAAKESLYAKMFAIIDGSAKDDQPYVLAKLDQGSSALSVWDSLGSYLGPYLEPNYGTMSSTAADKSYPAYCGTV